MWTIASSLFSIIKNPKILGAIAAVAVLAYYQISLWSLEHKVEESNLKIKSLRIDLKTANSNTKKAKEVNDKNKGEIDKCQDGVSSLDRTYKGILKGKDKTIASLKHTIAEFKKPVIYPKTATYKECKFEIKTKDSNEKDSTFSNLLNIGN